MTSPWSCRFLPILLALAFLWSPIAQAVEVDEPAPSFSVQDLEGNTHALDQLNGTVVLLFFFSPENPFCVTHAPQLEEDIWGDFSWHNFQIMGINVGPQEVEAVEKFLTATNVEFPLIHEGAPVGEAYQVRVNTYVVIDGQGIVRYISSGSGAQAYNGDEIHDAVSGALENVLPPKEATWGRIKTLFEEGS